MMADMRLVAFTDYVYHEQDGAIYAERAFALFMAKLEDYFDELTIVGRLDPDPGVAHYRLPPGVKFVALPHYASLSHPLAVCRSLTRSLQRFWGALDRADRVWLLGPYPHAVAFALVARLRRRPLVLGVRQDLPTYVRSRRPNQPWSHRAADLLERAWRRLARGSPVIVVGPELGRHYQRSPGLLEIAVSLVSGADIEAGKRAAAGRSYDGELRLLSVGRIDSEKNPLLLAEILAQLRATDHRWHLVVCGEGPLAGALAERLEELGLSDYAELRGYVPVAEGLLELYRSSHVFLHVSLTEGLPQVLLEAFASGLPVVATAVGGVREAAGEAALLIPPSAASAAAAAAARIAAEPELRGRLIRAGFSNAGGHTLDREAGRVAAFVIDRAVS